MSILKADVAPFTYNGTIVLLVTGPVMMGAGDEIPPKATMHEVLASLRAIHATHQGYTCLVASWLQCEYVVR